MTCLLCLDANEYAARGRPASAQQKTRRGLPPGRPGVVSVNTLFWKILVTRVKRKMCDASVVSLSCCPNSVFARARHFRALPVVFAHLVIAGLDPAIHPLRRKSLRRMMDPRVKPAGDACVCATAPGLPVTADAFAQIRAGVAHRLQCSTSTRCILPPSHRGGEVMRKFLFATAALVALASPAIAADMRLPVYKAPPVVPAWSWTGCFLGGHAGWLWATQKDWIVRTPGGDFFGQSLGQHDEHGFVGGAQAGCDYQFAGGFVIGVQGDYAWTNAEGSHDSAREIGVAYHSKVRSLASVTGRVGYAWGRFLGYVRGGGAW